MGQSLPSSRSAIPEGRIRIPKHDPTSGRFFERVPPPPPKPFSRGLRFFRDQKNLLTLLSPPGTILLSMGETRTRFPPPRNRRTCGNPYAIGQPNFVSHENRKSPRLQNHRSIWRLSAGAAFWNNAPALHGSGREPRMDQYCGRGLGKRRHLV